MHAWIATRARENDWDLSERAFGTIDIVLLCEASKWVHTKREGEATPMACRHVAAGQILHIDLLPSGPTQPGGEPRLQVAPGMTTGHLQPGCQRRW